MHLAQHQLLKSSTPMEVFPRSLDRTGKAAALDLRIDAVEASLCSRESGDADHGCIAKHAHLHRDPSLKVVVMEAMLSSTKKRCSIGFPEYSISCRNSNLTGRRERRSMIFPVRIERSPHGA